MSTEQDKDTFSLKSNRGGDGLDCLGGTGVLLGSPDKKKRKSNTQVCPQAPSSLAPLSLYAPPPNPSANHLVAANPFDDNYNTPSFKPISPANSYFIRPHDPGFSSYGPPRMVPLMSNRRLSSYAGPYPMRNQLLSFAQNQMGMGLNRPPSFNPNYGNQPPVNNNIRNMPHLPIQRFQPGLGDNLNQGPLPNVNPSTSDIVLTFGPEDNRVGNPPTRPSKDSSPGSTQQQLNKNVIRCCTPLFKQDLCEVVSSKNTQNTTPCKQSHGSEDITCQVNSVGLKSKNRGSLLCQSRRHRNTTVKINGITHPNNHALKKSPQSGMHIQSALQDLNRSSGGGGSASNKTLVQPSNHIHSSTEPVFPCGMCLNEVNDDQEAILCEASCQKWFHRVCTGMTETAYNLLTAEVWAVWGCDVCMKEKGAQLLRTKELIEQPAGQPAIVNSK